MLRRIKIPFLLFVLISVALTITAPRAAEDGGRVALGVALRKLNNAATFMMATAHPDDENSAVLTMVGRGLGARAVLVTATRGDGGQNEIGPELGNALAALRTEELLAAHRTDGAEQFFTRAVDFGYSFSIDETFEKWGKSEILGDFVRHIRTLRPDVIVAMSPEGRGGGQHHQASARLAREAFRAAADPAQYPEQLKEGLRPWQAKKFYFSAPFGMRGEQLPTDRKWLAIPMDVYDRVLGGTYAELGMQARSMHKCQGFGQLLLLPGQGGEARYELADTTLDAQRDKTERGFFDGIDTSIEGLAQYAGGTPGAEVTQGLHAIATQAKAALDAFDRGEAAQLTRALAQGLRAVRDTRARVSAAVADPGRQEINFRLEQKERQFQDALMLASGMRIETLANDGLVVAGQPLKVNVIVADRIGDPVAIRSVEIGGVDSPSPCQAGEARIGNVYSCNVDARVPASAQLTDIYWMKLPDAARYVFKPGVPFGVPFTPSPFVARIAMTIAGQDVNYEVPVEYRYEGNIFSGEKRMQLKVVPDFAVELGPEIVIIPAQPATGKPSGSELRVTVINGTKGAAQGDAHLVVPQGWTVQPATTPVSFTREDEAQTLKFTLTPPAAVKPGDYSVRAVVTSGGRDFDRWYQVVEYPHIHRRHLIHDASSRVEVLDVRIAPKLTVGYVMGVGDQVPPALQQLGANVVMLGPDDLAWGDLSRFNVIVTGVRAYERRADLRAHNKRLLDYAERGGIVIVQYNKFEFNEAQYGPYPAKVSSNRVTDENSPVKVLEPDNPIFTTPNKLGPSTWAGWVQERGLYFLGERDPRYVDLVELQDPFEYNAGPKRGALVEAQVGRGKWIYVGLGLWRQLPAGTPGAYALMANLLSLKPTAAPASGK